MGARARKLITMDAAADWLGVSKRHVRWLISSGQLPAYRISEAIIRIVRWTSFTEIVCVRSRGFLAKSEGHAVADGDGGVVVAVGAAWCIAAGDAGSFRVTGSGRDESRAECRYAQVWCRDFRHTDCG
jgi:excisionase family DNA binding protein